VPTWRRRTETSCRSTENLDILGGGTAELAGLDRGIDLQEGEGFLVNLASALITRYRHTRERHNTDEVIIVGRRPASNGGLRQLEILASALLLRADRDGSSDALGEAIDLLGSATPPPRGKPIPGAYDVCPRQCPEGRSPTEHRGVGPPHVQKLCAASACRNRGKRLTETSS
jgi:hypothetical protein